jgi:glycosyltransferase involved in cell wall biosynthesis
MQPVSFVMPAFNCAGTIKDSVESVFAGNFFEGDEVIIVNDGSSDTTQEEIFKLSTRFPAIVSVDNKINLGCPQSRNIGIKLAKNSLIFNIDADNILAPHTVEKLNRALCEQSADVAAFGEYRFFSYSTQLVTHRWICQIGTFTLADIFAGAINPGGGGNFLYTKKSWEKIGGYWEYGKGLNEAWGFSLKQLVHGAKFLTVKDTFYYHRYGHKSLFIRESADKSSSSEIATKFVENVIDVLDKSSAEYVLSDEGRKVWFDNLNKLPLKLKNNAVGKNGQIRYNYIAMVISLVLTKLTKYD